MRLIDLNVDIGEGFGFDEALVEVATSANVCAGAHAGSAEITETTIRLCERKGVRYGIHPGMPDRESMGRRIPQLKELPEIEDSLAEQFNVFRSFSKPQYIKPHGALYNVMVSRGDLMHPLAMPLVAIFIRYAQELSIPLMVMPGCMAAVAMERALGREGIILEGFADRRYMPDGSLMPRTMEGCVLDDADSIKAQALILARQVDSICLHGDTPGCLDFARMVRETLEGAGFEVGWR